MEVSSFQQLAPGRLVSTINGVQAFVPSPIPTGMSLPGPTVRLLARAENKLGRLAGTAAREINPYLVGSPLLHREAILSSRMEGTVTTPEKLVLFQAKSESLPSSAGDADTQEVVNYIDAMRHGLSLLKSLPICLRLIRAVHGVLLKGVRGERERPGQFRTDQNWIRGRLSEKIEDARFVPPPAQEMNEALHEFEEYLNIDPGKHPDPLLIQLALVHYQFETIHPFRDGNGRVGRLLIPLVLCSRGRLETPLLYLSAFFERNRDQYVDLLLQVSQTGNWIAWIDFFLRAVLNSAEDATQQAAALLDLRQRYHRRFQKGRSSARLIRLIDRLFESPSITIGKTAELLDMTHQAAASNIRKLVGAGILREITGQRRNQVFVADEIIHFMYDQPGEHQAP